MDYSKKAMSFKALLGCVVILLNLSLTLKRIQGILFYFMVYPEGNLHEPQRSYGHLVSSTDDLPF